MQMSGIPFGTTDWSNVPLVGHPTPARGTILFQFVSCAILSLLMAVSWHAEAAGDAIRFTQDSSGTIAAVLVGSANPCSGSVMFPLGVLSTVRNGNEFAIASQFAILDPPGCPSQPQPYEVAAVLGRLADGHYTAVWTFGSTVVRGVFDIRSGVFQFAPNPVPTLPAPAIWILLAIILASAATKLKSSEQ